MNHGFTFSWTYQNHEWKPVEMEQRRKKRRTLKYEEGWYTLAEMGSLAWQARTFKSNRQTTIKAILLLCLPRHDHDWRNCSLDASFDFF